MSRRRDVLHLLFELERHALGEAAIRRGELDIRIEKAGAERAALLARRAAASEAPGAEALPHLASFRRAIAAEIASCDAARGALGAERDAAEEEIVASWRRSEALRAVARRPG